MSNAIDGLFDPRRNDPAPVLDLDAVRGLLQAQANTIVSVGTGGDRIQNVDDRWQRDTRTLNASFRRLGLQAPFPWGGLWDWYGFYTQNLATYQERRTHIRDLTQLALQKLDEIEARGGLHDPAAGDDTPSWENLNGRISGLVEEYSTARDRDGWQDVGRRSREILIDFGKLIAEAATVPDGQEPPRGADAKAWFYVFLDAHAQGRDKAELRAMMRTVWDLAQKVTHGDIADVDAFAAAQATVLLVRTAQKMLPDTSGDDIVQL